jgi:hypothetical protein
VEGAGVRRSATFMENAPATTVATITPKRSTKIGTNPGFPIDGKIRLWRTGRGVVAVE